MKNITILLFLILISLPHPTFSLAWDLDSSEYLSLMNTDYFYLSLIPENNEVVVAVIGTGIEPGLAHLDNFIYTNPNETLNGLDDDNNGVIDDIHGATFLLNDDYELVITASMKDSADHYGHETLVASIIASSQKKEFPSIFGASMEANKIKLLPIRFLENGSIGYDQHTYGINYAVSSMSVDIMHCSYGDNTVKTETVEAYQKALDNNIIIVSSSGNTSKQYDSYPILMEGVIVVGGLEKNLSYSEDSSYGHTDFVAFSKHLMIINKQGTYLYPASGTSFAAPQITGAIAKILSYNDTYTRDSVYTLLKSHAIDAGNTKAGHGYINFKSLTEEFLNIETKYVKHPDKDDLVFEIVYATDKASGTFTRGFIRYIFLEGTRYNVFQEISI